MTAKQPQARIGTGATDRLSLRVSVAALARVVFRHPDSGAWMLALERQATLAKSGEARFVEVKSQPFGGALRILDVQALRDAIGDFHFDSEPSRAGQDFRIFIEPSQWSRVLDFCLQRFRRAEDPALEGDPLRELTEEFAGALGISLAAHQLRYAPVRSLLEPPPSAAESYSAREAPTARLYRIFEAHILDSALARSMLTSSEACSEGRLRELALRDRERGGHGWASAVLVLPLAELSALYAATALEARNRPVYFESHRLDETVAAVLQDVTVPRYRRL